MERLLKLALLVFTLVTAPTVTANTVDAVNLALRSNSLASLNPGGSAGTLSGYAAICLQLSLLARLLRQRAKSFSAGNILWWCKTIILIRTGFIATDIVGTYFVDEQFGFLAATTLTTLSVVQLSRIKFPEYDFDLFVSGVKLRSASEVLKERGSLLYGVMPWGADFIEKREERLHCLLFGNIGGGKTTYMKMMMAAVAKKTNEIWVVFDPKIELVPYLVALGKRPLILNPLDTRGRAWDLSKDIVNSVLAEGLAELLVDDKSHSGGGGQQAEDDHWTLSARNILVALIEVFIASGKPWDLRDICLATSNTDDLTHLLKRNSNASIIIQGLSGTHSSGANDYMLTVNTKLRPLHVIASRWHKAVDKISIKELVSSKLPKFENCALVLGTDHTAGSIITSLNELMFERFQQLVMNEPETFKTKYRVWADELSSITRRTSRSLVSFMTKARSKGGAAVLTAQNEAGTVERFGKEVARQIFDTATHKAVIGGVDGETAKTVSEELGDQDLVEAGVGYARGERNC